MKNLFDLIDDEDAARSSWKPPEFPLIASAGITEVELDCETTSLRWWEGDILGGTGVYLPDGRAMYLPLRHQGGKNLPVEQYREWAKRELRNVHITNLNTRFDIHTHYAFGVDFEAQGCTVSDVSHYAALLDDHRQRNSLEALCKEFLADEEKVKAVNGRVLDSKRMMDYPAEMVAVRAIADVRQVHKLKKLFLPELEAQDLMRVKALEDAVIFVVCEMERNGSPINHALLDQYIVRSAEVVDRLQKELRAELGFPFEAFHAGSLVRAFQKYGLPIAKTAMGAPSFTDAILKSIDHPTVAKIRKLRKYLSLRSKYIVNDKERLDPSGILRYALHQLRAQKDEAADAGDAGTISGRFSSTEITDDVGVNIQQRIKVAKQRVSFGFEEDDPSHDDEIFPIRTLHVPESGLWLSADAKQIEYRLFAHYANNPKIIQAYAEDPDISFHKFTHKLVREHKPDQTYRQQKDYNFANVYGAGLKKKALMLGFITQEQFEELNREGASADHPLLAKAKEVDRIYEQILPEVRPLLRRASHLAMPACGKYCKPWDDLHRQYPHRGYVHTYLGRRARFPNGYRSHKALNSVIQGTAADIMKQKLVELHRERKYTGLKLRFTVHDEVNGDIPDREHALRVREVLDAQSFQFRIPIRWDVSIGKNWAECGEESASL